MDYKSLKKKVQAFRECDETEITVEKDFVIDILEEVLATRRRNTAKCRQNLARNDKLKLNNQE